MDLCTLSTADYGSQKREISEAGVKGTVDTRAASALIFGAISPDHHLLLKRFTFYYFYFEKYQISQNILSFLIAKKLFSSYGGGITK